MPHPPRSTPTPTSPSSRPDLSLVLCGEAGQGIQTIEHLLTRVLFRSGFHLFASREYMSRVRGGSNSTQIRVGVAPLAAEVDRIDLLLPLHQEALSHLARRITPGTIMLGDPTRITPPGAMVHLPLSALAAEAGNPLYEGTAAAAILAGALGAPRDVVVEEVRSLFGRKDPAVREGNQSVAEKGFALGADLAARGGIPCCVPPAAATSERVLLSGSEAFALGALAGGCDFLAAYPMTPSTGVMTFLAPLAERFGVVVEQAEDEIGAVNMALGAWYAGARALASTSGGGFALMVEALSLAGMIESPLVVHLGQRPGPATGLPTRTEQGDLLFALHAGHGEFPRALLAPGSVEQAYAFARASFDLADRWQVPVLVLTDQFLNDASGDRPAPLFAGVSRHPAVTRTEADYRRYRLTPDGVSPRGIPGWGEGVVAVDSDEHDQEGHITEEREVRRAMVEKRLRKLEGLRREALPPELTAGDGWDSLAVCWGSTRGPLLEAQRTLADPRLGVLHIPQPWPLHPAVGEILRRARRVTVVEGNATGQLAHLLARETGRSADRLILRYDGHPFTADGLAGELAGEGAGR